MSQFVHVALPLPIFKNFTYSVPDHFADSAHIGVRVTVPFGKRSMTGVIVDEVSETTVPGVKPLSDVLDTEPLFNDEMLRFADWMSEYYV